MGRLLKSLGFLTVLAAVFLPALTAGAEEPTRREALPERSSAPVQSSKIQITVSGKELLDALQTDLKHLKQFRFEVTATGDTAVLTTDKLDGELAELLDKARTLMRKHPGRIEIINRDWNKHFEQIERRLLPFEGIPVASQMTAYGLGRLRALDSYGGVRRGLDVIVKTPFTVNGYAYAEEDREHATELERQCHDLAAQYMSSNDEAKRTQLETQLKGNLNELFDLKLKGFQEKIACIEREVQRLRTQLDERKNNKDVIVSGRFKELVGEHDHLQW
jgi:hypothetical protein